MWIRFGDLVLDGAAFELRHNGELVQLEPQVFKVLSYLVANRERVVPKEELLDEVWGDRFVSQSALTSRIKDARRAVLDDGQTQAVIRTVHGVGYRFVATVDELQLSTADDVAPGMSVLDDASRTVSDTATNGFALPASASTGADGSELEQQIRFVETGDGMALAMAETGRGPCLVKTATFLTQVDKDAYDSPIWGHWVRGLSRSHRYVRYDPRGCGLSDRDLGGSDLTSLDLWVDDLERVIEETGQERVALLGVSQGGPVAIAYAARHPERVTHLILSGTYCRGMRRRGDANEEGRAALQVDLARVGWGTDNEEFRQVFARQFVPGAQPDEIGWFSDQLRLTTNGTNAPLLEAAFHDLDISDLARSLEVPTLVFHALGDRVAPFEEGRRLAGFIPGARFVPLESRNHVLLQRDAAFATFLAEVEAFTST
ncbi:MAG: alpha/beta fold hydrolase [Acidimicrobiales bacterium]